MNVWDIILLIFVLEFNLVLLVAYRLYKSYKRKFYPDIKKVESWIEKLPPPPK